MTNIRDRKIRINLRTTEDDSVASVSEISLKEAVAFFTLWHGGLLQVDPIPEARKLLQIPEETAITEHDLHVIELGVTEKLQEWEGKTLTDFRQWQKKADSEFVRNPAIQERMGEVSPPDQPVAPAPPPNAAQEDYSFLWPANQVEAVSLVKIAMMVSFISLGDHMEYGFKVLKTAGFPDAYMSRLLTEFQRVTKRAG